MTNDLLFSRVAPIVSDLIAADTQERVQQVVSRFSQIVRDQIRTETGLKLLDGDQRLALPIRVTEGMPISLAKVIYEEPDPIVWRLLALRARLLEAAKTLEFLTEISQQISDWPQCPDAAKTTLWSVPEARQCVDSLGNFKRAQTVLGKIKEIVSEDILGAYFYPPIKAPYIEIYWMPIGLIAQSINVSVENLTLVVLIHELTHGYTHIGRDIDSESWERDDFAGTDVHVKEGLAQHYTAIISEKLESRAPGCHAAYKEFLKLQSGPYLFHLDWFKEQPSRRGEAVRYALLAGRRGPIEVNDWWALLEKSGEVLRSQDVPPSGDLF